MMVNMQAQATEEQINHVVARIKECGYQAHMIRGEERTVIGVVGKSDHHRSELDALSAAPGVEEIIHIAHSFKLASRSVRPEGSIVELGKGVSIGGTEIVAAAGPCAVESAAQINEIAERVARAGAKLLRGGAFKPRSSPYSFQGLGEEGLKLLRAAADRNGLLVVSEVMDPSQIAVMLPYVDVLQVGARNMQNYYLLRGLGETRKPVLLKRGMSATIEELLLSAEYIMSGGNYNVILCERGIRTFDTYMRNTMDIAAIPVIKQLSHLPVVADPSHGTGRRDKVAAMARAAVAAGADGLIIEVHQDPERALSDGAQSLYPEQFTQLMAEARMIAPAVGRRIADEPAQHRAAANSEA
jgi:3-deoxy-7-phosphoheptulonate synthase